MIEHVHTPEDGRGHRHVFVNGKRVEYCFYADMKRGIARAFRYPYRLDKHGKRALSRQLRGRVEVESVQ